MKNSDNARHLRRLIILCTALFALAALPFLSSANSPAASNLTTSVNIVNNSSSRQIRAVYLSHVNADDWTGNQLGERPIAPGQSVTLNNVSCDQSQLKVIGEDQDGCFLSAVVSCGGDATWTITNDTAIDCGQ